MQNPAQNIESHTKQAKLPVVAPEEAIKVFSKVKTANPTPVSKKSNENLFNLIRTKEYDVVLEGRNLVQGGMINNYSFYTNETFPPSPANLSPICIFSEDRKLIETRNKILESVLNGEKLAEIAISKTEKLSVSTVQAPKLHKLLTNARVHGYELHIISWEKDQLKFKLYAPNYSTKGIIFGKILQGKLIGDEFIISSEIIKNSTSWDKCILPLVEKELKKTNYQYRKEFSKWLEKKIETNNISALSSNALSRPALGLQLGDEYRFAGALTEILLKKSTLKKESLWPVRIALLRTLEKVEKDSPGYLNIIGTEKAILFTKELALELISLRKEKVSEVFLNKDFRLIVILGSDKSFHKSSYEELAATIGITEDKLKIFKFENNDSSLEKKKEVREYIAAVSKTGEKALIWVFAHGIEEGDKREKSAGVILATVNEEQDITFSPKELAENLKGAANPENLRVCLNNCFSYEHASQLGEILGKESPYIFSFAPRGTVTFMTHGETAILEMAKEKGESGLLLQDIYQADSLLNRQLDQAVETWAVRESKTNLIDMGDFYIEASDIGIFMPGLENLIEKVEKKLKNQGIILPKTNPGQAIEVSLKS